MEETLFKLARAITDTGTTDTVSSEGGTITYRITSLKRKLVNGKVVSTSTPSCTLTSVIWATGGGVTVGDGYLDVKINYSKNNTGSSRSTTLTFTQNESNNKINLTVTQGSGVTYSGYIRRITDTLPLGGNKGDTANILVMAYLKGSDGSKKTEVPHLDSVPDWCSVSVDSGGTLEEDNYMLFLTALSSNQTGANRSGHIRLICGDTNLSISVTQTPEKKITVNIKISVSKSPDSTTQGLCNILANQLVTSSITFILQIQYGVSSNDVREYIYTLGKGSAGLRKNFAIQDGANPQVVDYSYYPQEDSKYIYSVTII